MGNLIPDKKYIYESNDKGKTVYARVEGSTEKVLVGYTYEKQDKLKYEEFLKIIELAKDHPALKKSLDDLFLIYNLTKDHTEKELFWHPV